MKRAQRIESESVVKPAREQLMNEFGVAEMLNLSVASLRRWRLLNKGPRFLKIGAGVRYREADVLRWLQTRTMGGQQ
jgi:hypothetical protein